MKAYLLILFLGWQSLSLFAQEDSTARPIYFEKAPEGLVRFFFDKHYFLVDKDCTFKSIERLSQFIVAKNVFHGEFKDFGSNGKLILSGYYDEGIKNGLFKAFHPNGVLKWEVTFQNNNPIGNWNYYYPDGKPMLTVSFGTDVIRIVSLWDQRGRQRVVNGAGNYEFKMPFEFYNEYGYPFFERKGKLKEGLPFGYWTTNAVDEKGRKELMTEEVYNTQGVLQEGYNLFEDLEYNSPVSIIPAQYFVTAESLTSKACNFDDFSGFNTYLADVLEKAFSPAPEFVDIQDEFGYTVNLDNKGTPKKITLIKSLSNEKLNQVFQIAIKAIPFYFPSLNSLGEAVEDEIAISGKLQIDKAGNFDVHTIRIDRENQH